MLPIWVNIKIQKYNNFHVENVYFNSKDLFCSQKFSKLKLKNKMTKFFSDKNDEKSALPYSNQVFIVVLERFNLDFGRCNHIS